MTVRGKIKNGKVVLEDPKALADGTEVEVRPAKKERAGRRRTKVEKPSPGTLADRLAPFIDAVKDLPPDMSVNLDHYLYGHPKQK